MQALREVRIVSDRKITIDLPEYFDKKEIEIIIIPYNDKRRKPVNFNKFFGVMKVENLDEEIRKLRGEWEREWNI